MRHLAMLAAVALVMAGRGPTESSRPATQAELSDTIFGHAAHAGLFPSCVTCHAGAVELGAALWPTAESCATCHDGVIEERVTWEVRFETRPTNLRFSHEVHRDALRAGTRDPASCVVCHAARDAQWMDVQFTVVEQCLTCHEIVATHFEAPDSPCATCHVALSAAPRLSLESIRNFPTPASHDQPGFAARSGHGLLAYEPPGVPTPDTIAASCATCHARDLCIQCHVDAPEQPAIRALARDARSLVHQAALEVPETHEAYDFVTSHGETTRANPLECRTCHTQESCLVCHAVTPEAAMTMHRASAERGAGAVVERRPPSSHRGDFGDLHAGPANTRPQTCASCHAREDCLQCHRPSPGRAAQYHPADFLVRHPAQAYSRATSCSDCHNPRGFCVDCHASAGLTAVERLTRGYHDIIPIFSAGHGPAARQSLETCVSCHAERDCLPCHSAAGGRRFNPHGPGFDAERQARKNVEVCTVCHGSSTPVRP